MKKLFLKSLGALLLVVAATACENDELNSQSIFDDNEQEEKSAFDLWLERHYVEPYNVNFEYRMPDRETHFNYWVAPPPLDKSIEIAKLIKFVLLDGMAELMQEQEDPLLLARTYFPRLLFLVGSYEIDGSGKVVLASAENGIQINLLGVKFFDRTKDCEQITGTMIHEFAHILDGNRAVPIEYDLITKEGYIGDQYTNAPNDYLENGFLSNYARSTPAEDIAVMVAADAGLAPARIAAELASVTGATADTVEREGQYSFPIRKDGQDGVCFLAQSNGRFILVSVLGELPPAVPLLEGMRCPADPGLVLR